MSSPKVCVIILNWNGLADTLECLGSLRMLDYRNYKAIVVDNASRGDDVQVLRQKFGDYVHVIQNDVNYGFAEGNNIGIRYAIQHYQPDYLFLLNNDTVVAPDALSELVRAGEGDAKIGVLGPKIYYHDVNGRKDIIWSAGGKIRWWHPWVYDGIGCGDEDGPKYQELKPVPWVSGAAIMIKRQVLDKVSLLDAGYFSGNEDVDYCFKARKNGFIVVCVPTSLIWHKVGRARPHPTSVSQGVLDEQTPKPRRRRGPRFADLPPYYRLLRRNFPAPVLAYHLLISPVLVSHRTLFWLRDALARPRRPGS
jgi:GT2 family glycosyltransferase